MNRVKTRKYLGVLIVVVFYQLGFSCTQKTTKSISRSDGLLLNFSFDGRDSFSNFQGLRTINWGEVTNADDRFGKEQSSMFFEPNSARIDVTSDLSLKSQLSIFCWVKLARRPDDRTQHIINNGDKLGFLVRDKVGLRVVLADLRGGKNTCQTNSASMLTDNKWHMVGFTYDGIILKLYIDDKLNAVSRGQVDIADLMKSFTIGNHINQVRPFRGYLDDMKVYGRVISEDEVRKLAGAG
ncbi:LamG domain-containing protein [uncultured Imperialibacter sp.]|uniref:LamG domain-containing protein n=1 Tax=uncultured Imperialibacter sp. TaxID=1672639 RepID=UPI0030D8C497|tara:strand:- start:67694 stop:68410 length:717 start_codon:yes stop_codon:yes gene_type:complete